MEININKIKNKKAKVYIISHHSELIIDDIWNIGDMIRIGDYRHLSTVFLGCNRKLVPNPDYSGSGYLTIPNEISCLFDNAVLHFEDILSDKKEGLVQIILSSDDKWLIDQLGKALPNNLKEIIISYTFGAFESLHIQFDDSNSIEYNDLNISYEDIIRLYQTYSKGVTKTSFIIWYSCKSEIRGKVHPEKIKNLPKGWTYDSGGGGGDGELNEYIWIFEGPKDAVEKAMQTVIHHYKYNVYNFNFKKSEKPGHRISIEVCKFETQEINGKKYNMMKPVSFYEKPFEGVS